MTVRSKQICTYPGCGKLIDRPGRCANHVRVDSVRNDAQRGTAASRGYGYRWQQARKLYLQMCPLCVRCQAQGVINAALIVDHVTPHKGDQALFWDQSNWQPLCKRCHDQKTAQEDGGFGNISK